tara:strand:+ start:2034 stop:2774 length:741 start_codon:yes stop_codon:yes gene_type:complete
MSITRNKLHDEANFIISGVNEYNILDDKHSLKSIMNGTNISFLIVDAYENTCSQCDAVYTHDQFTGIISGSILYVSSVIGNKSGTFLFLLQMLLALKINATEITLDNVTNQPERAASQKGIYDLFWIDQRGAPRSDFLGKTLSERLNASTGQMRWGNTSDAAKSWAERLQVFAAAVNKNDPPWRINIVGNINSFIASLKTSHQPGFLLGGKRTKKKRKTRKQKRKCKKNKGSIKPKKHKKSVKNVR